MKKSTKLILVALILLTGALIAYKMYNKPHIKVSEAKADVIVTAISIMNDFNTDENNANTKFLDKIVQVEGEIANITKENGNTILSLKTNDDFGSVNCFLSEASAKQINTLKENQKITVKGICTGYLMDVILVKSEIIK